MKNSTLKDKVIRDIVFFVVCGSATVVVHGGGPINSWLGNKLGIEPVNGLQVTDAATMDVSGDGFSRSG